MTKNILKMLNDDWREAISAAVFKEFGEIGFDISFSIMAATYASTWKPQGVKKDREIKSFVKGVESGYIKAIELITTKF